MGSLSGANHGLPTAVFVVGLVLDGDAGIKREMCVSSPKPEEFRAVALGLESTIHWP